MYLQINRVYEPVLIINKELVICLYANTIKYSSCFAVTKTKES